ncbi:MAG: sulfurtransferase [Gammaproteobacteria bacterium]|nr:sulfurtransferase [Gammaproteobacteria bacterium]
MASPPALLLEPQALQPLLGNHQLLVVDLSSADSYNTLHIPGAISLNYNNIVTSQPPTMGLLPNEEMLSRVFSKIGLTPSHHVVAYDDDNSGKACRLLWTLDCLGHKSSSLLNGGLTAWRSTGMPMNNQTISIHTSHYEARIDNTVLADKDYILEHLNDPSVVLLDARSEGEFKGEIVRAKRSGHIPGAVNINWTDAINMENNLKLRSSDALRTLYASAGITKDKQIISYCQTHHRSAHSYIVLKSLGYKSIKGYHGAWSEWGNDKDTPIEQ